MLPYIDIYNNIQIINTQITEHHDNIILTKQNLLNIENNYQINNKKYNNINIILQKSIEISKNWLNNTNKLNELINKKERITLLNTTTTNNNSYEAIELIIKQKTQLKDQLQYNKDNIITEESNLTKKYYLLKSQLNEYNNQLNNNKINNIKYNNIELNLITLNNQLKDNLNKKEILSIELKNILQEYSIQINNLEKLNINKKEINNNNTIKIDMIKSDISKFTNIIDLIKENENKYNNSNYLNIITIINKIKGDILILENQLKDINTNINTINKEINTQEHVKRNMIANLELRTYQIEISELRMQLQQQLQLQNSNNEDNSNNITAIERTQQRLQRQISILTSERDTLRGKLEIYTHQSIDIHNKLNHPTYKGIEERYRKKNIEFETTNLAISDLESYYNAL